MTTNPQHPVATNPVTTDRVRRQMPLSVALAGPPNCGKSTLFNGLTGGRTKVANHSGVTVETHVGRLTLEDGRRVRVVDLPGIHGLEPTSGDTRVAVDILFGRDELLRPDAVIVVIDAANLRTHLQTALQLKCLGRPVILALNMIDLATRDGVRIDVGQLRELLGVPVVEVRATRRAGRAQLVREITRLADAQPQEILHARRQEPDAEACRRQAREIAKKALLSDPPINRFTRSADRVLLHPLAGPLLSALVLFLVFQAVFGWAETPMGWIESGIGALTEIIYVQLPSGWFRSLLADGIIAGVGSVVVFLPQIVILFSFLILLEGSGYLARSSFLADEAMRRLGLGGQAVIPLLSAYACAIPGIMSARTITHERDRLVTILIAPLMTCSARIPIYTLMISAFVPPDRVGPFQLQGLVMFGLYLAGTVFALVIAFVLRHRHQSGGAPRVLALELPTYKWPQLRDYVIGIRVRAGAFLRRAGTLIMATSIALWFLTNSPSGSALRDSYAGKIGSLLEPLLRPIGFNLEIAIALVPGLAAREVVVGALGTVYAVAAPDGDPGPALAQTLQNAWTLPTALAFLAWYVVAPQCLATFVTIQRETRSWKLAAGAFCGLLALSWVTAGLVHHTARLIGL